MANQHNACFGCGDGNPQGMHLAFERDEEKHRVIGRFRLGPEYQGGPGMIHGGIVATVLDEAMSKVSRFSGVTAVTAELKIQYLKPVRVGQELHVEAFLRRRDGRRLYHEGEIRDAQGVVLARGEGFFVEIDRQTFAERLRKDSGAEDGEANAV